MRMPGELARETSDQYASAQRDEVTGAKSSTDARLGQPLRCMRTTERLKGGRVIPHADTVSPCSLSAVDVGQSVEPVRTSVSPGPDFGRPDGVSWSVRYRSARGG